MSHRVHNGWHTGVHNGQVVTHKGRHGGSNDGHLISEGKRGFNSGWNNTGSSPYPTGGYNIGRGGNCCGCC